MSYLDCNDDTANNEENLTIQVQARVENVITTLQNRNNCTCHKESTLEKVESFTYLESIINKWGGTGAVVKT